MFKAVGRRVAGFPFGLKQDIAQSLEGEKARHFAGEKKPPDIVAASSWDRR